MHDVLFTILLVEDDAAHAEAIKRILHDSGMQAHVAVTGSLEEFRQYLKASLPDIVLMDLNLPDGRATEVLVSPPEEGPFPVLLMTAYGDEQTAVQAIKAGAIDYLVKSPEAFADIPRVLVRTLREWRLLLERKHAREALQASDRRYRHLFENMLEGYAHCKMLYADTVAYDFTYIEVNEKFEQLTGLKNVVNRKVSEVIPGIREQNPELFEIYGRVASTGNPEKFETYIPVMNLWFSISVYSPERGHFVAVFDNITERKKIEIALRESEQQYRTLADSGQALIWTSGTDKLCNYFNQAWLRFTGRTLEQEMGNGWAEGVHPDDFVHCLNIYVSSFDRREPFSMDYRLMRHDGAYRWVQDDGCPRYDSQGKFIGYIGYCLDITDRKVADQILSAQRKELSAIYENAPFIMMLLDRDRRVVKVNRRGEEFSGSRTADLIGLRGGEALKCIRALDDSRGCGFGPDCASCRLRRIVLDTFETGAAHDQVETILPFLLQGRRQDAALLVSTTRLQVDDEAMVLVTLMDISERKRFEREAKHAEAKLIHANKMSALGMLVSSVAHEVNNPNNYIMFNSSLLAGAWKDIVQVLDSASAGDPSLRIAGLPYAEMREAVPKLLTGITEGSRRIKNMVEQLRDLSRDDPAGLNGSADLNAAVRNALTILQNEILLRSDSVSAECADHLPQITGSTQQIEQVVINLVQNALQALSSRSQPIRIRTYADGEQNAAVIEVKDGGCGISSGNLSRIHEPFFSTKLDSGGTGLGLSISNTIISDHGGRIEIESEEGRGTTVRVVLPVKSTA